MARWISGYAAIPVLIFLSSLASAQLLQKDDMVYLGSFTVPEGDSKGCNWQDGKNCFTYGGVFAVDPVKQSLFMKEHAWQGGVGEVKIPDGLLGQAALLQDFADVTDGRSSPGDPGGRASGLVADSRLIVSASSFYDASCSQRITHGVSGLDLSKKSDFLGWYTSTGATANPRSVGGYMTMIPSEWQQAFGGTALTGNCCLSIISCSSAGPAASVFNHTDVGAKNPLPMKTVLFYPLSDPLAPETSQNEYFNLATKIGGVAFPSGTRSVLFIGRQGTGPYCYGGVECNDHADSSQGTHAYPYRHQVWAYDALDLIKVRNSQLNSWDVRPYAIWTLPEMDSSGGATISGAAFDILAGRLYVTTAFGDQPKVHVYSIGSGSEVCASDSDCDDNDACTHDTCTPEGCVNTPSGSCATSDICPPYPASTGTRISVSPSQASLLPSIVANAAAGSVIELADGTYSMAGTIYMNKPMTLRSASGRRTAVTLDGNYRAGELINIGGPDVNIVDLTLKRANYHPIHIGGGGHRAMLYNLHIVDGREQQIKINPDGGRHNDNGTLACSLIELTDAGRQYIQSNPTPGFSCYTGGLDAHQAWGWTVRDNEFRNIYCANGGLAEHAIHFWNTCRDITVERNRIFNCARGIGFGLGSAGGQRSYPDNPLAGSGFSASQVQHISGRILNNFVYGSNQYIDTGIGLEAAWNVSIFHNSVMTPQGSLGIDLRFQSTNADVANNIVSPGVRLRDSAQPIRNQNNIPAGEQNFIDAKTGDLHLRQGAAAIDSGLVLGIMTDIDLQARDSRPDIGADEYRQGSAFCGNSLCDSGETCESCPSDCRRHEADSSPCDNCISPNELLAYISLWKQASGISLQKLIQAITMWKAGCIAR